MWASDQQFQWRPNPEGALAYIKICKIKAMETSVNVLFLLPCLNTIWLVLTSTRVHQCHSDEILWRSRHSQNTDFYRSTETELREEMYMCTVFSHCFLKWDMLLLQHSLQRYNLRHKWKRKGLNAAQPSKQVIHGRFTDLLFCNIYKQVTGKSKLCSQTWWQT